MKRATSSPTISWTESPVVESGRMNAVPCADTRAPCIVRARASQDAASAVTNGSEITLCYVAPADVDLLRPGQDVLHRRARAGARGRDLADAPAVGPVAQDVPVADSSAHMAPPIIGRTVVFAVPWMIVRVRGAAGTVGLPGVHFGRNSVHQAT